MNNRIPDELPEENDASAEFLRQVSKEDIALPLSIELGMQGMLANLPDIISDDIDKGKPDEEILADIRKAKRDQLDSN